MAPPGTLPCRGGRLGVPRQHTGPDGPTPLSPFRRSSGDLIRAVGPRGQGRTSAPWHLRGAVHRLPPCLPDRCRRRHRGDSCRHWHALEFLLSIKLARAQRADSRRAIRSQESVTNDFVLYRALTDICATAARHSASTIPLRNTAALRGRSAGLGKRRSGSQPRSVTPERR